MRYPSPGFFHQGVPSLCSHPRCSFPRHCRVLCQVPACRWREGLKCAPGQQTNCAPSAPSSSLRSPVQQTNCAPGLAVDLWVSAVVVDQHRLTTTPRGSKAGRIRRLRLPRKKETRLQCPPTCQAPEKTRANRALLLAPLSHTCLCCLPVPTPDSRPRRARSARGWLFTPAPGPKGKGQHDLTRLQRGRRTTNNEALSD